MQPISELKKHYEQVQIDAGLKAKKEPKFPLFPELGSLLTAGYPAGIFFYKDMKWRIIKI